MSGRTKFYITTAISYPNGVPHIGHAYEAIATDTIARFERLDGKDVYFLTGTDEHGLKMKQTAAKEGLTPRELADRNAKRFREMAGAARPLQRRLHPHHRGAPLPCLRGDLAAHGEGRRHLPQELRRLVLGARRGVLRRERDGRGPATTCAAGRRARRWSGPRRRPTSSSLSAYEDKLLRHYEEHPDFILPPERRNEVVSFVKGGLEDLSISRTTLDWGIPVPDLEARGREECASHVMYVWVDALTNYITGVGFPDETAKLWHYWPADVHVIGKDILRFHAVYWPAFLMSAGLPLPKRVFSHGFVLNKGEKMSKSIGNVVDPFDLVHAYGLDPVRYFFLREVNFGQDGNYSPEAIANRINADLANDLGNLAQRSLSMIAKNCDGKVPEPGDVHRRRTRRSSRPPTRMHAKAREAMDRQAITKYLDAVWAVVADANRYFAGEEPWAKKKTDFKRMETILYVTAEVVRQVAVLAAAGDAALGRKALGPSGAGGGQARVCGARRGRPARPGHASARAAGRVPALRRARGRGRRWQPPSAKPTPKPPKKAEKKAKS